MKKAIIFVVLAQLFVSACEPPQAQQKTTDVDVLSSTQPAAAVPEPSPAPPKMDPCAAQLANASSGPGKVIFLNIRQQLPWGASESRVRQVANTVAARTDRGDSGLTAYTNGYDDWINFEFSSAKLSKVRERHNNAKRKAPFVNGFLHKLKSSFGHNYTASSDGNGACNAVWEITNISIKAVWQESEWFVDIYYEPIIRSSSLSEDKERKIWNYYAPLEDSVGKESALAATATRFGVTRDDVFQVIVRGLEKGWPELEITTAPVASIAPTVRGVAQQATGRETLPSEDRRAYDELKAKGYSDSGARNAASAIRRLCEAGKGTDCQ